MMRKPNTFTRELFRQLQTPITILVLNFVLLHAAARHNVVASVFAAGPHVPGMTLLLAVSFLGVRFVAVALIPGFIAARIVAVVLSRWSGPREAKSVALD